MVLSSFKHALLITILMFLNSISIEASDVPIFLRENCTTNETFTPNSTFQFNLKTLLSSLSSNATGNTEFYNITVSSGSPSDTVYGLFNCRGDVPSELCKQCVVNATQRLGGQGSDTTSTCQFSKGAIIWYDECMVRYSNRYFFSTLDTRPRMRLRNTANVSDPERFMRLLYTTLNETADEAANSSNGAAKLYYATKEANISGFQTLYCLTQCTPDLSPRDCRVCLSGVIGDLPWCCPGNQGGRVLYPSCNFRYELYPFYRILASPAPEEVVSPTNSAIQKGNCSGLGRSPIQREVQAWPITKWQRAHLFVSRSTWQIQRSSASHTSSSQPDDDPTAPRITRSGYSSVTVPDHYLKNLQRRSRYTTTINCRQPPWTTPYRFDSGQSLSSVQNSNNAEDYGSFKYYFVL